jgi:hypothetical protein
VFDLIQDKESDKDQKAQLKLQGGKAVEQKNYAGALKFYIEVYHFMSCICHKTLLVFPFFLTRKTIISIAYSS